MDNSGNIPVGRHAAAALALALRSVTHLERLVYVPGGSKKCAEVVIHARFSEDACRNALEKLRREWCDDPLHDPGIEFKIWRL